MGRFLIQLAATVAAAGASAAFAARHPEFFDSKVNIAAASVALILLGAILFRRRARAEDGLRFVDPRWSGLRATLGAMAAWSALAALAVVALDQRAVIGGALARLNEPSAPSLAATGAGEVVVLERGRNGHFTADVEIDGHRMVMLVDTGASDIALPYEKAEALGLDMDALRFDHPVVTANGEARVAPIRLASVTLGGITLRNVDASVAERGKLASPLLGMSFLGALDEVAFRRDRLFLRR